MESWPRDDRNDNEAAPESRYKAKGKKAESLADVYPNVRQGMVGAATLVESSGRLNWTFLQKNTVEASKTWQLGKSVDVFPATRAPPIPKTRLTIKQSAEQGANFIRTHLADADVPAEILRDQLIEESNRVRQLEEFDPYSGDILASMIMPTSSCNATGFVVFPMGETLTDLNISFVNISKQKGISFKPAVVRKKSYTTPIQQIISRVIDDGSMVAVRTYTLSNVLRLNQPSQTKSSLSIESLATYSNNDTGNRRVVDMKLRQDEAIFVNDSGCLYAAHFGDASLRLNGLSTEDDHNFGKDPDFWRLALDENPGNAFLASSDQIWGFDSRATASLRKCFELSNIKDYITSIEDCKDDGIIRFCSTNQLVWLDKRKPNKPLLALQHQRQFDRYLSAETFGNSSSLTFLSSRNNNFATVYDVSRSRDGLLHTRNPPAGLLPMSIYQGFVGQTMIASPFQAEPSNFILLRLSNRGSLTAQDLFLSGVDSELHISVESSVGLRALESKAKVLHANVGELGIQEKSQVDFFPAYDTLFRKHNEDIAKLEEDEAQSVYDLLDQLPYHLQKAEHPSESILTAYDIAFRAGDEPRDSSRSDFLTGSVLNSVRGYRALQQGRLNPEKLVSKAPWHFNLERTLHCLEAGTASAEQDISHYDLEVPDDRPIQSLNFEKRNREQLSLDLALSQRVFASYPFPSADVDKTLETMTEALSLGDEPPGVDFGFLRPVSREKADHYSKEASGILPLGLGSRLLLMDWEVGSDPSNYVYRDPYDDSSELPSRPQAKAIPSAAAAQAPSVVTHRPPQLVTAKSQFVSECPTGSIQRSVPLKKSGSQQTGQIESQGLSQSQDVLMASTQILPGRFGGRPTKKKVVKKRLGGF